MPDSTFVQRPMPKKRIKGPVEKVYKDVEHGFGELKRQSGAAVETIKESVRKIKRSVAR